MSKILSAVFEEGFLKIDGKTIAPYTILSAGVKASEGVAVLEENQVFYICSNAEDIKDLITNLGNVIDAIQNVLTGLDAVSVSPGSTAALIALVGTAKTTLALQKDNLK